MIQFKDFVPRMIAAPGLFKAGEYESIEEALSAANRWIKESGISVINVETVVLPKLQEFLAARGLRLSPEKTRIVRDTDGFDFVGRQFKRLSPTKFRRANCGSGPPRRSSKK